MKNRLHQLTMLGAIIFLQAGTTRADINLSAATATGSSPAPPPTASAATTPVTPLTTPIVVSPVAAIPPHTTNYTVAKGDSLTSLANKFNTTRKKLKDLNSLATLKLTPGQIILVPSYKKSAKTAMASMKAKAHHTYAQAQPVQDFDIPASTFASCPVPEPNEDGDASTTSEPATENNAPIAQLVSPNQLAADQVAQKRTTALGTAREQAAQKAAIDRAVAAAMAQTTAVPSISRSDDSTNTFSAKHFAGSPTLRFAPSGLANPSPLPPPSTNHSGGMLSFFRSHPTVSTPSSDWGNRFLQESRALGAQGIGYDESWRPPGEARSWDMDCSNTSRYLYKITTGINLPRTASDQYYYLHLQGKAWDVPTNQFGWADGEYLRNNLKPGDLLFWENTYRPERTPPITHVMVFLGTNAQGQWIMAGSQSSRGGEHNRRNGGPDIYLFHPSQACGGYTTWLGMVHHKGRFCAFGRPLEADPSKFASQ